ISSAALVPWASCVCAVARAVVASRAAVAAATTNLFMIVSSWGLYGWRHAQGAAGGDRRSVDDVNDLAGAGFDDIGAAADDGVAVGDVGRLDCVEFDRLGNGRADVQLNARQVDRGDRLLLHVFA